MADSRVLPISSVKYGLKAETSFGVGLDSSGADGTAYLTQPVVQAQKPTFNIQRESRLLSGRGSVKNAADTVVNTRGGTVTMPFDMLATPRTLAQHCLLVGQENGQSGSIAHEMEIDGSSNNKSIGGTITAGLPHSCNLAYFPFASEGIKVCGVIVSDLSISGDVAANNGLVSMSGNYFSGFSNPVSTSTALEVDFTVANWAAAETTYYNVLDADARTLDVDDASTQTFIMKSFNFNISNGVNRVGFDTNGNAEVYAFPEYVVTGDITIKYDDEFDYGAANNVIQDFLDGDTLSLAIKIGDGTIDAEGECNILAEIQYTGDPGQDISEAGIFHTLAFECVQNSSTEAFKITSFKNEAVTAW
jgi:hypothetical protein|tara:strand:+ start:205 stop:1287 length:1083 start_codon:yes stop_codon:yes gene_type:complete